MNITAADLYRSILFRAADIYEVDYEDVERDIGQQFDPLVRFLAGATASELERVYQHIYDTESRLQKRLAKVLLPEYFHLPQPAHALATARPSSEALTIDETLELVRSAEENQEAVHFSPVFRHQILPASIALVATETKILDPKARPNLRRGRIREKEEARRIIIGIEASEPLLHWEGASLYFDLRGRGKDESERAQFFSALPNSHCRFGGFSLTVRNGLPPQELLLEDYLNGNERLHRTVRARYQRHFLTFGPREIPEMEPLEAASVLERWFRSSMTDEAAIQRQLRQLAQRATKALYWMEVEFSRPIEIEQLTSRLTVRLNVFPVVNRQLNGHRRGEHHYLQTNSIKWVPLQPKQDFVSIRRVYEEKPPEYPVFVFKPFADFKEERKPAYTLRFGGVGRWDDFNAWQRLAYVVSILQENYRANELIEKVAASLSLEDVHHLLGKKISKTAGEQRPTRDIYVLLHSGVTSGLRVRVEYWTSLGERGNGLAAKTVLDCTSRQKSSLDKEGTALITASAGGRDPLNSTQQLNAMKSALLSRGRIVTREDIKIFCKEFLRDKLLEVEVRDGVGTDPRFNFGITRRLEVLLKTTRQSQRQEDWEAICQQLQTLIEEQSTSSIPIRVWVDEASN